MKGGFRRLEGCRSEGVSGGNELRGIDAGEGKRGLVGLA